MWFAVLIFSLAVPLVLYLAINGMGLLTSSSMYFLPACFCTDTRFCIRDIKIGQAGTQSLKSYSVCTIKLNLFLNCLTCFISALTLIWVCRFHRLLKLDNMWWLLICRGSFHIPMISAASRCMIRIIGSIELNQKCYCVATQSILTDWIKLQLIRLTGREMPDLKKKLKYTCFYWWELLPVFRISIWGRTQRQKYS